MKYKVFIKNNKIKCMYKVNDLFTCEPDKYDSVQDFETEEEVSTNDLKVFYGLVVLKDLADIGAEQTAKINKEQHRNSLVDTVKNSSNKDERIAALLNLVAENYIKL